MKRILCLIFLLVVFSACAEERKNDQIETDVNDANQLENESNGLNLVSNTGVFNEYSVLITAKAINIRQDPSTVNKENIVGQVHMGEIYPVLEEINNEEYKWYRIGDDKWIANDGTWCIEYNTNMIKEYPYVADEEEKKDILSSIETGGWLFESEYDSKECFLIIMEDASKFFDCNIVFWVHKEGDLYGRNISDCYKYIVSNIVKTGENDYDLYVDPVKNNGCEDYSTGVFRIMNVGMEYNGYKELDLSFDVTLIQNNNDGQDEDLRKVYNVNLHYRRSQMGI